MTFTHSVLYQRSWPIASLVFSSSFQYPSITPNLKIFWWKSGTKHPIINKGSERPQHRKVDVKWKREIRRVCKTHLPSDQQSSWLTTGQNVSIVIDNFGLKVTETPVEKVLWLQLEERNWKRSPWNARGGKLFTSVWSKTVPTVVVLIWMLSSGWFWNVTGLFSVVP